MRSGRVTQCQHKGCENLHRSTTGKCPSHREQLPVRAGGGVIHVGGASMTYREAIRLANTIVDAVEGAQS